MILRWTALALLALATAAAADPVAVTSKPVSSFQNFSSRTTFGPFVWRGGMSLSSTEPRFGGLSGLVMSGNCEDLLAISDAGRWFRAKLSYTGAMLSGLEGGEMAPMLDSKGKPQRSKVWGDAEAVTALGPGKVAVAYESRVRFGVYDIGGKGFDAPFQPIPYPKDIDHGPDNGEVESLGLLPDGRFIAIAEKNRNADGSLRAWIWRGRQATGFAVKRLDDYDITDLAVLADGTVLTLERSFSRLSLPGMAIRRFATAGIGANATVEPEVLFQGRVPLYAIDNMEGIAVCRRDGETRITIMSDNNFNTSLQSTLLLQFAYTD